MAKITFEDRSMTPEEPQRTNVHYRVAQIRMNTGTTFEKSVCYIGTDRFYTVGEATNEIKRSINMQWSGENKTPEDYIIIQCFNYLP
jgi:hypothetical protein